MTKDIEQRYLLESVVVHARDAVLITDADLRPGGQRILYANPAMLELTGYDLDELLGKSPRMFQGEKTDPAELERIRSALEAGEPVRAELVNYAKDHTEYLIEIDIVPVRSPDGAMSHFIAVQRDITEWRAREVMLERSREFQRRLATLLSDALAGQVDVAFMQRVLRQAVDVVPNAQAGSLLLREEDGSFRYVAVMGFSNDLMNVVLPESVVVSDFPDDRPIMRKGYEPHPTLEPATKEALYGSAGRAREICATLNIPVFIAGELRGLFNLDNFESETAFDEEALEMGRLFGRQVGGILQRIDLQSYLEEQSKIDVVTGLPNRLEGERILGRVLREAVETETRGAVLLLDIDGLKAVNDAYGHALGDLLLKRAGERIASVLQAEGTLTRWAGDEFMVVLPSAGSTDSARATAGKIAKRLERPFYLSGATVKVTTSIGLVDFPARAGDASAAIQNAHIALQHAKRAGKATCAVYTTEMGAAVTRRIQIEEALRASIASREIRVHFQPRVDLATSRVQAVEALARWSTRDLGAVSPAEFIPIADQAGLIQALGEHVLDAAVDQARAWLDAGTPVKVAVNLSITELQDEDLVDRVERTLARHGLPARWLEIEVTESAAMTEVEFTITVLKKLRDLGVSIAVDDFGTAYSSLAYLRLLPVSIIKIDRSFVMDIADDPEASPNETAIVQAIIAMAHGLSLRVVAEGVETEAQLRFLERIGCDEAQGYLFGRAVPAAEVSLGSGDRAPA